MPHWPAKHGGRPAEDRPLNAATLPRSGATEQTGAVGYLSKKRLNTQTVAALPARAMERVSGILLEIGRAHV